MGLDNFFDNIINGKKKKLQQKWLARRALLISQRKDRMKKLNGLDLRYTSYYGALLQGEYGHNYEKNVLIDCTDLDNPKEYFTGIPLKANDGLYLVTIVDNGYGDYSYAGSASVSIKLKQEFAEEYENYHESGLCKIYDMNDLARTFGDYTDPQKLALYKKEFTDWVNKVKNDYKIKNNINNTATNSGAKVLQLGARNNNNINKK